MRYFARIRYVGTNFHGFQFQPNLRTVQGELNRATEALFGVPCAITGCSRTDSGVHAEGFCLLIEPSGPMAPAIPPSKLPVAIAPYLPPDLSLFAAQEAPSGFHPRYDALGKEYRYEIWNSSISDPFCVDRAWHYPHYIGEEALQAMNEAASHLVGKHDFYSFMAKGSTITDTVRTVHACCVEREGDFLHVTVRGDGFLYNMVRIIVGTLIDVAEKRILPQDIPAILERKERVAAGLTAPACGLYLAKVFYPDNLL